MQYLSESPPNTITFPTNGFFSLLLIMFAKLLSNDSKQCLLIIGASSQVISEASLTKLAKSVSGGKLHREYSSGLIVFRLPSLSSQVRLFMKCNSSQWLLDLFCIPHSFVRERFLVSDWLIFPLLDPSF